MWSTPIGDGGVVGGNNMGINGTTYYMGGSYNTRFSNALIINGKLYYEESLGNSGSGGDYICRDLRTGELLWRKDFGSTLTYSPYWGWREVKTIPRFGYLYRYDDGNQHGVLPDAVLWTSTNFERSIDASTGEFTPMNWTNVPSGADYVGPKGEIYRLVVDWQNKRLIQWNSSKMVVNSAGQIGVANWYTAEVDASDPIRFDWNISVPNLGPGRWSVVGLNLGATDAVVLEDKVLLIQGSLGGHVGSFGAGISEEGANITCISLNPNSRGSILWTKHYPVAPGNVTRVVGGWDLANDVFVMHDKETMVFNGYSLKDGSKIWGPTEPTNDYTYFRDLATVVYCTAMTRKVDTSTGLTVMVVLETVLSLVLKLHGEPIPSSLTSLLMAKYILLQQSTLLTHHTIRILDTAVSMLQLARRYGH